MPRTLGLGLPAAASGERTVYRKRRPGPHLTQGAAGRGRGRGIPGF
jgi:phage tail tape-measure protein